MIDASCYLDWLKSAPPRFEAMRGLHEAGVIRLDDDALAAKGLSGPSAAFALAPERELLIGGYGEDRALLYATPLFQKPGSEPRSLHLGLDIFGKAGLEIFAPLAGRVHSFADNRGWGDYGPTIILQHEIAEGCSFCLLFGHLSRASLNDLAIGRSIDRGERLGRLGAPEENGDWPPHLHIQVILDIGTSAGDFPGACRPSEAEAWLARCPDPRALLGLIPT